GSKYVIPREPKVARVDPAFYDAYAGRYEADVPGKGKEVITITREKDRLYCRRKANSRVVLVPESETSFYIRSADAEARFVKDASGKVASLVLVQDGEEITARRMADEVKDRPASGKPEAAAAKAAGT